MKRITYLLLFLLSAFPSFAEGGKSQVPLADPYILLDNGKYYAYGTHDASGIRCYSSDDLRVWKDEGQALNKANTTEQQWFWAPEVYHVGDKYIMYFSANEHLFAATATSPTGPFKQVGGYQMDPLIGSEKCIDSHVFFDDDGKAYVFFVRFTDGNCIWQAELEDDYITPRKGTLYKCFAVSQSWEDKMGRVNEGPNVIKVGKRYFLTYSGNDYRSQDYGVGYAYTTNIAGHTWTKFQSNPILCRFDDLVGTGHHSLFKDKEGIMRIVFHAHNSATEVGTRLMYIGTVEATSSRITMSSEPIIRPTLSTTAPYSPELVTKNWGFKDGGAVTVDLNNSGFQDIVAGGTAVKVQDSAEGETQETRTTYLALYTASTHKWTKQNTKAPFNVATAPCFVPCDINNDGKMDIIAFEQQPDGDTSGTEGIFLGKGTGAFSAAAITFTNPDGSPCDFDLKGPASADILDIDNDGRLDIVCAGQMGEQSYNVVLHNTGSDVAGLHFAVEPYETEFRFSHPIIKAADMNNDGFQDFVLSSSVEGLDKQTRFTDVYLNDTLQHGHFLRQGLGDNGGTFKRKAEGAMQIADFNNDGWLDIYLAGPGDAASGETASRQRIYANKQMLKPTFANLSNSEMLQDYYNPSSFSQNAVGVIDWNNNGHYDLLVGGFKSTAKTSTGQLYINNSKGRMSRNVLIPGATGASIIFPDYNGDGRKDFLLNGNCTDGNYLTPEQKGYNAILCYNLAPTPSRPEAPTCCEASVNDDGSVTLSWQPAESAKPGFTYEVFIRDSLGNVINSIPSFIGDTRDGVRKVNAPGRIGCCTQWQFRPTVPGNYSWGVQAIDAAYTGSTFTPGPSFTVAATDSEDAITAPAASPATTPSPIYDLSGRRTGKAVKGLYISEGKIRAK